MNTLSKDHPLKQYQWGAGCDVWSLVDSETLAVKIERMPAFASETTHLHQQAQQFFFILKGEAVFETEEGRFKIKQGEGFSILPGLKHRVLNEGPQDLEFILSSGPSTNNDRINFEQ